MRRGLVVLFLAFMPLLAFGQWGEIVPLTADSFVYDGSVIILDDSFRLHVLGIRGTAPNQQQPTSMHYFRYDNWGQPLAPPLELWPGNQLADYIAGALLDRNGVLHVLWSRSFSWPEPVGHQVIYTRLSTDGEFLTPPTVIDTTVYIMSRIDMVQAADGLIWAAGERWCAAFTEDGEIAVPLQLIIPPGGGEESLGAFLALSPSGGVQACIRYLDPAGYQSIAVVRLDTTVRQPVLYSTSVPPFNVQMTPEAFFIDSTGAYHFIIYRQDRGLFYQRNAPTGELTDSLDYDDHSEFGATNFTLVGGDTLVRLWRRPNVEGLYRAGFHLNGDLAFGPQATPAPDFTMESHARFIWRAGSYWALGRVTYPSFSRMLLLHVPGSNEPPPNRVEEHLPATPASTTSLVAFSEFSHSRLQLVLPAPLINGGGLQIFNILGQQVLVCDLPPSASVRISVPLPQSLARGKYFGVLRMHAHNMQFTFIHL